jgi:hypothetical protein
MINRSKLIQLSNYHRSINEQILSLCLLIKYAYRPPPPGEPYSVMRESNACADEDRVASTVHMTHNVTSYRHTLSECQKNTELIAVTGYMSTYP